MEWVIQMAYDVFVPILAMLVMGIAIKVFQRLGLSVSAEKQAKLEKQVQDLLFSTEEWAQAKVKAGVSVSSKEKAEKFLTTALQKIPNITAAEAAQLAQQELPKVGLGASGFLAAVLKAAKK